MITSLIIAVVAAYGLLCLMAFIVAKAAMPKWPVRLFTLLAAVVPAIAVWAFLKTLFGHSQPLPYHVGLAQTEDEIEERRVAIFGGEPVRPSVAELWKQSYLLHLQKTTSDVAKHIGCNPNSRRFGLIST